MAILNCIASTPIFNDILFSISVHTLFLLFASSGELNIFTIIILCDHQFSFALIVSISFIPFIFNTLFLFNKYSSSNSLFIIKHSSFSIYSTSILHPLFLSHSLFHFHLILSYSDHYLVWYYTYFIMLRSIRILDFYDSQQLYRLFHQIGYKL